MASFSGGRRLREGSHGTALAPEWTAGRGTLGGWDRLGAAETGWELSRGGAGRFRVQVVEVARPCRSPGPTSLRLG